MNLIQRAHPRALLSVRRRSDHPAGEAELESAAGNGTGAAIGRVAPPPASPPLPFGGEDEPWAHEWEMSFPDDEGEDPDALPDITGFTEDQEDEESDLPDIEPFAYQVVEAPSVALVGEDGAASAAPDHEPDRSSPTHCEAGDGASESPVEETSDTSNRRAHANEPSPPPAGDEEVTEPAPRPEAAATPDPGADEDLPTLAPGPLPTAAAVALPAPPDAHAAGERRRIPRRERPTSGRFLGLKLLDRYLLRQFLSTFLLLVLGIPLLFVITDLTENLDKYLARGISTRSVALSYLYFLPQSIYWAMPIAALVGTLFTIGNMTRHQEIAAAKAGGISFYRLVAPLFLLATVLAGAGVFLGELVTETNRIRAEVLGERRGMGSPFRMNFVFQTEDGQTLSVRRLDTEAREMNNIVVEREAAANGGLGIHQVATRAQWSEMEGWTFQDGYLRLLDDSGEERTFSYTRSRMPLLQETPEELLAEPKRADQMNYEEITRFINAIERSGGDSRKLQVEKAQKLALPIAILVIVLFGAPLSTSSKRGGAAYGIGISLAVTLVYLMLFKVGTAIGASGALHPQVAAWMPNALFFTAALFLLWRVRT